jgi:hypothetical protein
MNWSCWPRRSCPPSSELLTLARVLPAKNVQRRASDRPSRANERHPSAGEFIGAMRRGYCLSVLSGTIAQKNRGCRRTTPYIMRLRSLAIGSQTDLSQIGHAMVADGFRQKTLGRSLVALHREQKINGLAGCVHRTIEIAASQHLRPRRHLLSASAYHQEGKTRL